MRRVHEANLVIALHFTTDLKQLLNRDSSGHLISKTLLEESLRASFNHGWQWNLTGNDNSSLLSWGSYNSCSAHDWHFKYVLVWAWGGHEWNCYKRASLVLWLILKLVRHHLWVFDVTRTKKYRGSWALCRISECIGLRNYTLQDYLLNWSNTYQHKNFSPFSCPIRWAWSSACWFIWGFQSLSKNIIVSVVYKFRPGPPARVLKRNMK